MPYRLTADDATVADGVRRIAHEQIDRALAELDDPGLDRHETVHQVRKRCKKLRGLARLVRPAFDGYRTENRFFRDAARPLSPLRDAEALTEAYDTLTARYEGQIDRAAFAPVRRRLTLRRKAAAEGDLDDRLAAFRERMVEARGRIDGWRLDADGFDAVAGGLSKTYGRAVDAMAAAADDPGTRALHGWRKRVKYHWYHARLLRDLWPAAMKPHRDAADDLSDLLGDDHDLAVLRAAIGEAPDDFGERRTAEAFVALIDRRRAALQQQAFGLGRRLLADPPEALVWRWGAWWKAWRAERPPAAVAPVRVAS